METININGTEYVKVSEMQNVGDCEHVCIIADRGWIFEGYRTPERPYELRRAHVVRKWSNGLGIGGLASPEHKDEYTLDELGAVQISPRAVIAEIPLEW